MKTIAGSFFILIVSLCLWVLIGSIDSNSFDDQGLLSVFREISPDENGFSRISYMDNEAFFILSLSERGDVRAMVDGHLWDPDKINALLIRNGVHTDNIISASYFDRFKFDETDSVYILPAVSTVLDAFRLVLLEAIIAAENQDYDRAIFLSERALIFSQLLKQDENHFLIFHMIGLRAQHEALFSMYRLISKYPLEDAQIARIEEALLALPAYQEDGFKELFSGEFVFSRRVVSETIEKTVSERFDEWLSNEDFWNIEFNDDYTRSELTYGQEALRFLRLIFPRYFLHPNEMANMMAGFYKDHADVSSEYCNKAISAVSGFSGKGRELSFWDSIRPNGLGAKWVYEAPDFSEYYERRCFGHVFIESMKAVVAIKRYQLEMGELPSSLDQLVPAYLPGIPVDTLDGNSLKYSKIHEWLYSVGSNFEDNGGSLEAAYRYQCEYDDVCASNPTFPLAPVQIFGAEMADSEINCKH